MLVKAPLPDWPGGFTANWACLVIRAMAEAYAPWMAIYPLPPLYESGVRFRPEALAGQGVEEFANPWLCYSRGFGDCDDLTCWRLCELLLAGENPKLGIRGEWSGPNVHVLIRRQTGETEDPSIKCGAY